MEPSYIIRVLPIRLNVTDVAQNWNILSVLRVSKSNNDYFCDFDIGAIEKVAFLVVVVAAVERSVKTKFSTDLSFIHFFGKFYTI